MVQDGSAYSGLAALNIGLGWGGNTFTIANTATGTATALISGHAADRIRVHPATGVPTGNPPGWANVVNVGSLEPAIGGVLNGIQGALTVVGNGHDTMNLDDTGKIGRASCRERV